MPVDVMCPKCHSKLRAPDEVAGRNVRCKKCQEKFKVPGVGVAVDPVGETEQLSVQEIQLPRVSQQVAQLKAAVAAANDNTPLPPMRSEANSNDPFGFTSDPPKSKLKEQPKAKNPPPVSKVEVDQLVGGEPTFAMPGASEDAAPGHGAAPLHAAQFSFEESAPFSAPAEEAEEELPPKSVPVKKRSYRAEERSSIRGAKPAKSRKMLYIFGGIATGLLIGCGGVAAGVIFFAKTPTEAVAKATVPAGPGAAVAPKEEPKPANIAARTMKPTGKEVVPVAPSAPATAEIVLPAGGVNPAEVFEAGDRYPLRFNTDTARQVRYFDNIGMPGVLAVFRTQLGFNGRGAADTVAYLDFKSKKTTEFTVPADGITGARVFDLNDTGARIAIEAPAGRLTVYDFDAKTKIMDGVDIYAGLPERKEIAALAFGDLKGTTLAVVDRMGVVDVWNVESKQRTVTGKENPNPAPVAVEVRVLGSKTGLIAGKDSVRRVTWQTGESGPAITTLPPRGGTPTVVATSNDSEGKALTALVHQPEGSKGYELLVLDRAVKPESSPAKASWRVPLPADAGAPSYLRWMVGDTVLAVGSGVNGSVLLFDVPRKSAVAYVSVEPGQVLLDPVVGSVWLMATPDSQGKAVAVHTKLFGSTVMNFAKEAQSSKKLILLVPTPEGLAKK